MTIKKLLPEDRPRDKLIQRGPESLTNAELIAIMVGTGSAGYSALDIGSGLIERWETLNALFQADLKVFSTSRGVSEVLYCRLQASIELANRCLYETISRETTIENPSATRQYLVSRLRHLNHEVFSVLFLDNAHRVIQYEELFQGTINGASVYPRRVLERAMQLNAAAVILAHNHPSGVAEPSQADKHITKTLINALALVDIRVLDHFVIGDSEAISFAERGLI